jgi:hypothetical protein
VGHELGHLFDWQSLSDGDRRYFTRILHAPSDWERGGREWFADYYGAAAEGIDLRRENIISYAPLTLKRMRRFQAAMTRLGRRQNLAPLNLASALASAQ